MRAFSTDDGLPNNLVFACHTAADGRLWFGTLHGLARFDPEAEAIPDPPDVLITAVRIDGQSEPVPDLGLHRGWPCGSHRTAMHSRSTTPASRSAPGATCSFSIAFSPPARAAMSKTAGARLRPRARRSSRVSRAQLPLRGPRPSHDGTPGGRAAGVLFRVLPPFWQRPWFVALAVGICALAAWFAVRLRVARLLAVERARTRIASDLHDDVGSSLSRIGILGELALQRVQASPVEAEQMLGEIGREARELVEVTSDIVWAVDPHRDDLGSLVVRLRRFAVDLLEARGVELEFSAPAAAHEIALPPEVRRAFYLCLKESIHNVAKHSNSGRARVRLR